MEKVTYPNISEFHPFREEDGIDPKLVKMHDEFIATFRKMHSQILDLNERLEAVEKKR